MGKKVKILTEDPILSKNFKYDKRHKVRALEKAQSEEERAQELQKKKQLLEVERKVDEQIEALAQSVAKNNASLKIGKLKQKIFVGQRPQEKESSKSLKISELTINNSLKEDAYIHHYAIEALENTILKQKKVSLKQKIEQKTKEQIKGMFGNQKDGRPDEQEEEEGNGRIEEVYNLLPQEKKQHDIKFNGDTFCVSKLFQKHKHILSGSSTERQNSSLSSAQSFIKGYFDHLFIENKEEETIQHFRKIVVKHSAEHMQKCTESEKGRGFTNCKLLILTPFVGDACAIFEAIEEQYAGFEVLNKQKLDQLEEDCDFFRIGVKIIRKKQQLSYFSSFDHSDIIVASPVGLKSIIGSQGDEKRENSFISSVEILYIDRASVLMMQNWSHVTQILKNMNYMPRYESLKNSIESIRDCFLQLKGRLFRQNIVFSEYNFPQLNALKHTHFHNLQGSVTTKPSYKKMFTGGQVEQQFYKIELKTAREDLEVRFEYFKRKFWDDLHNKENLTKIVLFASSYFEYVKLKAFLEKVNASAQYICEHTAGNKVQSRLAKFNSDQFRILLTTERAYYFQVCRVRKFHHLYFYSLPKNSFIYKEMVSSITPSDSQRASIISIYTRFDALCLQRLVGSGKAGEMVREYCSNVSFIL